MTIFAVGFTMLAALLHVYIWVLESFRWTHPATRKAFGTTAEVAEVTKPMAYNQGFYNLFLAIIAFVGVALLTSDHQVGSTLALAGTGSMLAAAVVLVTHDRTMLRAALTQGTLPALAAVFLALGL